jgi:hypothetical protein
VKILVCGGRDYSDERCVERVLIEEPPVPSLVIAGGAPGADRLTRRVCRRHGIHVAEVEALWRFYGKPAGHLRNAAMLRLEPDKVIAFPGGRGTEDCIAQAEALGIPVERIELN